MGIAPSIGGRGGAGGAVVVAASNAPAAWKAAATYTCSGTGDQTQINSALSALGTTGDVLLLSPGTFSINAPIIGQRDDVTLEGAGRGVTIISQASGFVNSGNNALIQVNRDDLAGTNLRPAQGWKIADLSVYGNYLGTQGTTHGIHFKAFRSTIENVQVWGSNAYGIVIRGCTAAERGTASDWATYGTWIVLSKIHDNGSGGVLFDSASTDAAIEHSEIFENTGPGIQTGSVINEISNCYIWGNRDNSGGTQGNGIVFLTGAGRTCVSACKIEQNRGGIRFIAGSEFSVVNCTLASNSTSLTGNTSTGAIPSGWYTAGSSNQRDDIMFDGSGGAPAVVQVTGCIIDPTAYASDSSRYAISINSGDRSAFCHNDIGGGSTGRVLNNVPSNNVEFSQNMGYITEASGTATVTSAATSVVVTHGLGITPNAQDISLILTNQPTNAVGNIWISAVGSTTFQINVAAAPGTNTAIFGWSVSHHRFS